MHKFLQFVLFSFACLFSISAFAQPWDISGNVYADNGGAPLQDIEVCTVHRNGDWEGCATTDAAGDYTINGLPADGDMVVFINDAAGQPYIAETYQDKPHQDWGAGDGVDISGSHATGIDFGLADGTLISGALLSSSDGPVTEGAVTAFTPEGEWVTVDYPDGSGNWSMGLPPGDYIFFFEGWGSFGSYVDEYSDGSTDIPCPDNNCDWLNLAPVVSVSGTPIVMNNTLELGHIISGVIKDEGDSPTNEGYATVWDSSGNRLFDAGNDGGGNYETPLLGDGTYYVAAYGEDWGRVSQLWQDQPCPFTYCDITAVGTPVVISGADVTGIDFNIVPQMPATISGHIFDSSGNPTPGGNVRIFDMNGGYHGDFWVDENGYFETHPLDDGIYFAHTRYTSETIDEVWDGADGSHCPNQECDVLASTPIIITGGVNVSGIDFWLDAIGSGGRISGTITDGVNPIPFVVLTFYNSSFSHLFSERTDQNGNYQSRLVADGNFYVRTFAEPSGLAREFWNDKPCFSSCEDPDWVFANANLVSVTGSDTTGIDFELAAPSGYQISGQVTDEQTGLPLGSVYLILFDSDANWLSDNETDSDGNYSFPGLSEFSTDDYYIYVEGVPEGYTQELYDDVPCPGWSCDFLAEGTPITVSGADQTGHDIQLLHEESTRIVGTVTRADDGTPVPNGPGHMRIDLFDDNGNHLESRWPGNAAAQFEFIVGPGNYRLATQNDDVVYGLLDEVWDDHYCDHGCDPNVGDNVTVIADQVAIANFSLETGATISGNVTAEVGSAPLESIEVCVTHRDGHWISCGRTDNTGGYTVRGLPFENDLLVFINDMSGQPFRQETWNDWPGHDWENGNGVDVSSANATGINFALGTGYTISGTVLDGGSPVADIGVCVHLKSDGSFTGTCGGTDGSGNYTTAPLPPGNDYVAYAIGYERGYKEQIWDGIDCNGGCDLTQGDAIDLTSSSATSIDFNVTPSNPGIISGYIYDQDDQPTPGGAVYLIDQNGNWYGHFWTDDNGYWETWPLPTGTYYAVTQYTNGYIDDVWDGGDGAQCPNQKCNPRDWAGLSITSGAAVTGVEFRLEAIGYDYRIRGQVEDSGANPLANVWVTFYNSEGGYLYDIRTDLSGNYLSNPMLEENYYVRTQDVPGKGLGGELYDDIDCFNNAGCADPGFVMTGSVVSVSGGDTNGIDFILEDAPGLRVEGTVTDFDTGKPLAEVNLEMWDEFGDYFGNTQTDENGQYKFLNIPNGNYRVRINGPREGYVIETYNDQCIDDWDCDPVANGTNISVSNSDGIADFVMEYNGTTIMGTVTRSDTTGPVSSRYGHMGLSLFNNVGEQIDGTNTDVAGNYWFHLPGGSTETYYVTTDNDVGFHALVNECWDDVQCPNVFDPIGGGATSIVVDDGEVQVADFELDPAQVISGTVTATNGGAPIPEVQIDLWNTSGEYITSGSTANDGSYKLPVPGDGDYIVITPPWGVPAPYLPEVWDNQQCNINAGCDAVTIADWVNVSGGVSTPNIDFSLESGFTISGRVLDDGANPIDGIGVCIHLTTGEWTGVCGGTNGDGDYTTDALPPGNDYVAYTSSEDFGLQRQMWNGIDCVDYCEFSLGDPIDLTSGDATNIDFNLNPADPSYISGFIRNWNDEGVGGYVQLVQTNGDFFWNFWVDDDGNFTDWEIPSGNYIVLTGGTQGYMEEVWDGFDGAECRNWLATCDYLTEGQILNVPGGANITDINFYVDEIYQSNVISGTITDEGANPVPFVDLVLFNDVGQEIDWTETNELGDYRFAPRIDDRYYVVANNRAIGGTSPEVWDNVQCIPSSNCSDSDFVTGNGTPLDLVVDAPDTDFVLNPSSGWVISGQVFDNNTTKPLSDVNVTLWNEFGYWMGGTDTGRDGRYYFSGLGDGNYVVWADGMPEGYAPEVWDDRPCEPGICDPSVVGDPIVVSGGDQTTIDIGLQYTGTRIMGTITRSDTDEVVSSNFGGMGVNLYDEFGGYAGGARTDRAGNFQLHLPEQGGSATYYLATDSDSGYHGLIDECWDNVPCPGGEKYDPQVNGGTAIVLNDGTTEVADFELDPAQVISGIITESDGVTPIPEVQLDLWDDVGNYITSARTKSNGTYNLPVPGPGDYYVFTPDYGVPAPFLPEVWNNVLCNISAGCDPVAEGNAVVVIGSADTTGIDFDLEESASISGTVTSSVDGQPVWPQARLHDLDGNQVMGLNGNSDGTYTLSGIIPGTYYLLLNNRSGPLIDELWDDNQCPRFACDFETLGTTITFNVGDHLTGYDAALDPGSQISGTVVVDGAPPATFSNVLIYDADGTFAAFAFTDENGYYQSRSGLPAGSYYVVFGDPESETGYTATAWPDAACGEPCDATLGDPVVVNGVDSVAGIDFDLVTSLRITGHVKDAVTDNPMPGVQLDVWDENYNYRGSATTDENGDYEFVPDSNGSFWLFVPPYGVDRPYLPQVWPGEYCNFYSCDILTTGDPVVIDGSGDMGGIDFALDTGFTISGSVQDDGSTNPIQDAEVCVHWTDNQWTGVCVLTDASGFYETFALPGGADYVAYARGPAAEYQSQMWNGMNCPFNQCDFTSGSTIELGNPDHVSGINFSLGIEASISGRVTSSVDGLGVKAQVRLHDAGDLTQPGYALSDDDGYYTISGIPAGSYYLLHNNRNGNLVDELYLDVPCPRLSCDPATGTLIVLAEDEQLTGVDAELSPGSQITGTVTAGGNPVFEYVSFYNPDETYAGFGWTDGNGFYASRSGFPAGDYYVTNWSSPHTSTYLPMVYPNVLCGDPCDLSLGTLVSVNGTDDVGGIDFDLIDSTALTISGTVTSDIGAAPLEGILMTVSRKSDGARLRSGYTDANGQYQFTLDEARNDLVVWTRNLGPLPYFPEVYQDQVCADGFCDVDEVLNGTSIDITTGSKVVDMSLARSASISGTLSRSNPAGLLGDREGRARIYRQSDDVLIAIAYTDANGDYLLGALEPGNYYLRLSGVNNNLIDELYDDANGIYCPELFCDKSSARVFTITGTEDITNIDATLDAGTQFSGNVSENGIPLSDIFINFYAEAGELVGFGYTDGSGNYVTSSGFPAGNYRAANRWMVNGVQQSDQNDQYAPVAYPDTPCGTPCDVTAGDIIVANGTPTIVPGIDFQFSLLDVGSNLGFETGDLTSWILAGSGDKSVGAPGVGAQEGSYAARLTVPATATADVGNILQIFDASPGDEFYLSGYMLTESPQGASFGILKIEFTDASGNVLIAAYASKGFNDPDFPGINSEPVLDGNSPSNEWVFSEAQGVAPPGTTRVFFQLIYVNITAQEQSMWFDNIHMVQVPSEAGTEVISGTVTADDGGAPLSGINVCVANKNDDQVDACAITDSLGKYLIGNLAPANDYVVFTRDVGGQAYFREMYDSQTCCDVANGTSVDLTGGSAVIDFGLASSGRIAGYVTDTGTGLGIAGVWMWLMDESCTQVDVIDTYTDGGGSPGYYSISGVPDGIYYVFAVGEYLGYVNELYPDEKRPNPCIGEYPAGQAIVIDNNAQVDNVDFALDPGGSISGVISDSNGMIPSNQAYMRLYDTDGVLLGTYGDWLPNWTPDVSYVASGLLPGEYQVVFTSIELGLIDERFDDEPCPRNSCDPLLGDLVFIGPGEQVTGINGELSPGAVIRGRITDGDTTNGVPDYYVAIYNVSGRYAGVATTDGDGYFETSTGFPDGDYYLTNQFPSYLGNDLRGYLPQAWTSDDSFGDCGEPCNPLLGDAFTVSGLTPVENINMAMETGSTISGAVTTGGATPLPNITVQLRNSTDGAVILSVQTDGSGAYEFAGLGSGTYFMRTLNTQGYADRLFDGISCNPACDPLTGTPVVVGASSNVTGISFDLPVTPAIAGLVRDESLAPVGGVKVQAFDVLGTLIASTTSNAAGEYLIKNLYAGNFYVKTANTAGYVDALWTGLACLPGCNPTVGTQVPVASSGTVSNINLNLSTSSKLQGTVSNSGGPLAGVTVQVYSAAGSLVGSSISGANGSYSVSGLSAGNYHAVTRNTFGYINKGAGGSVCQPATCAPTSTAVVAVGVTPEVRNFVLALGGTVSGTVTNTAATPLQSVTVRAYSASGVQVGSATSGPAGNYSISGLAGPVVYLRTTNSLGYKNQRYNGLACDSTCNVLTGTSVAVGAGVNASGKNFSLALGGSIAGVVRDTSAAPLANVQVQVLDALSGGLAGYALTGPSGAFTVAGLVDGAYRLKAISTSGYIDRMRGGDHCSPEPCALASGAVTNVASSNVTGADITLSLGGSISGFVTTPQDPNPPIPLPLGTAWIYSGTGQLVKQGGIFNGSFFVNGLANGTYHMVVTNGSGLVDQLWEGLPCLLGSCDVTLGADIVVSTAEATTAFDRTSGSAAGGLASSQLNFSLDKGYQISGTLKHGVTPIASTKVYFFDAEGKPAGEATTNGLGEFTLDSGLPNGSYFAATSRAARPEDTPDQAADAEDGAVDGLTDEIYDGFACSGVCAPSVDSGIGTPIVIDGADETGIDIVLSAAPGITLEKHTNGVDADTPDGGEAPEIVVGATVNWTYEVTNSGGYDLVNIVVVDDPAVSITCGFSSLAVGESDTCTASGVAQDLSSGGIIGNCSGRPNSRLFQNTATVTAETAGAVAVMDEDSSHYCNPEGPVTDLIFSDSFEK